MGKLIRHFREAHQIAIGPKTAARLARAARGLRGVDARYVLAVTGCELWAMVPRRVDVTLRELRTALRGRHVA